MYLDEIKLWNFRKFGSGIPIVNDEGKIRNPDLQLKFNKGLNLIVGENDCGKSGILDAIKIICRTNCNDWVRIDAEDFFSTSNRLRIDCYFRGFELNEAKNFTEWLGREKIGGNYQSFLRLNVDVQKIDERILPYDVKGGPDDVGVALDAGARELIQLTFLKALRDAKAELTPKRNSRLSKILGGHKAFKGRNQDHPLKEILDQLKTKIDGYFEDNSNPEEDIEGKKLKEELDKLLKAFFPILAESVSKFSVTGQHLKGILESLKLTLTDDRCGLGSENVLFIATELLLLKRDVWSGLKLGLIEELEAHLHPQAQMRIIEYLQREAMENSYQLILTTHSPNLASKIEMENLIVCTSNGEAYSMGAGYTALDDDKNDYKFLKRFLDVTKANLFFAKGVIIVEGYAEAILLPVIAEKIDRPLSSYGVSIINVGSAAFLRYGKIFLRKDGKIMPIKVSVITDFDLRPSEYSPARNNQKRKKALVVDAFSDAEIIEKLKSRRIKGKNVKTFFSPNWTLEYCLALSPTLRKEFYLAVLLAWIEKKKAQGIKSMNNIEKRINNIDAEFNKWTDKDESIAFEIYNNIILKKQLSKAAIAQFFAEAIESGRVIIDTTERSIKYIINAICYVTK